jgi:Fe-S-cluster containining protein
MTNDHMMENGAVGADVSHAVGEVLRRAGEEIAGKGAVCRASGKCCKFETYGHRLYVTGVELLHFAAVEKGRSTGAAVQGGKGAVSLPQFFAAEAQEGCPYQVGGLCSAREGRPLGCRVYFCDESARGWENELYEKYHGMLRAIHERFGVPYRYVEWRAALRELA